MVANNIKDISVIILTFNEEKHIERCISNVKGFCKDVFIVDSFSTDNTVEISKSLGAKVFSNPWKNNYAMQFNWGLQNLPIKTKWVLRLDADEYLFPELIKEIIYKLDNLPQNISGVVFKRRHIFLNKWMKRGTYPVKLLRLFHYSKAICEQRWMDEHIELLQGESIEFENDFADHNLNNLGWWIKKHDDYSIREAIDLLDIELGILGNQASNLNLSEQAASKRKKKLQYVKQPLFVRSFIYFLYRFVFKLGFLESKEGYVWLFFQGWWYRSLVDAKIFEIKKNCGNNHKKIKEYIFINYKLKL